MTSSHEPAAGPADQALARAAGGGRAGPLVCRDLLSPGQREQALAVAGQLYPAMLGYPGWLAAFGSDPIEQVNTQVSRIVGEVAAVELPDLPPIRSELDEVRPGLRRAVVLCDELYAANEVAIGQLIGAVAVMELARDLAQADAGPGDATVDDPERRAERERITELVRVLEVRIAEGRQRLFVAWSTSRQLRHLRALHDRLDQLLAAPRVGSPTAAPAIEEAFRLGRQRRAEVLAALVAAQAALLGPPEHLDRAVVDLIGKAQPPDD